MFGDWDSYSKNIRSILERRISQIPRFDDGLFHKVERCIEEIPQRPSDCLDNLSHIEDLALDVIWKRELGASRELTGHMVSYWSEVSLSQPEHKRNRFIKDKMAADERGSAHAWMVSNDRAEQISLLQILTGSHQDFSRAVASYVSKDTYVLLNAIHSFRNRSQHAAGQPIHLGVAVSAIMLCIELLGCLSRELSD
jgi:hypothetical protein